MLPNVTTCQYPKSPEEAVRMLADRGRQALILAGGTTAALSRDRNVTTLVDLTRMGLDRIEPGDGQWRIGCNVRIQDLACHHGLEQLWNGMLVEAARAVGSRPIRNAVTVGGNAVSVFCWSDPPVAYLAMGAEFDLLGPEGERSLWADDFFARHPRQVLKPAEILTRVRIPRPGGVSGGAFIKLARTAFDLAVVDAAVCLRLEGERCTSARVAVGGTRTVPWRAREAESALEGRELGDDVMAEAARRAREATRTADDVRTSADYRREMVEVMVRRTIRRARDQAGKGS